MTDTIVRLHITPFSPDLFAAIINPSLAASARNLSYHHIQTAPEHDYGYIDLPHMAAEKVKQKFNGAILKGSKLKIETARPEKQRRLAANDIDNGDGDAAAVSEPKGEKLKRKRKLDDHRVVDGHEIATGRKIKRGWTDPNPTPKNQSSAQQSSSKFSDKEELLFRTTPLPNQTPPSTAVSVKKGKRKGNVQVVHEFAKSTAQPSFLRVDGRDVKPTNLAYIDKKGWVDDQGKVVEPETEQSDRTRSQAIDSEKKRAGVTKRSSLTQSKLSSAQSRSPSVSSPDSSDTSSSGSSDSSDDTTTIKVVSTSKQDSTFRGKSSSMSSDTDSEATGISTSKPTIPSITLSDHPDDETEDGKPQTDVHPLEALFKKPKRPSTSQDVAKPSLEISTSFSFFDTVDADEANNESVVPMTPFTSQDMRSRGLRSAAPTPDTAYPSRFGSLGSDRISDDDDGTNSDQEKAGYFTRDDLEGRKIATEATTTSETQISEFEKKFWENRGDNNRAWKLRRRTVLKEKRQRENRARRPKNW